MANDSKPAEFPFNEFIKWYHKEGERFPRPTPQDCGIWAWNLAHELRELSDKSIITEPTTSQLKETEPQLKESGEAHDNKSDCKVPNDAETGLGDNKTAESVEVEWVEELESLVADVYQWQFGRIYAAGSPWLGWLRRAKGALKHGKPVTETADSETINPSEPQAITLARLKRALDQQKVLYDDRLKAWERISELEAELALLKDK